MRLKLYGSLIGTTSDELPEQGLVAGANAVAGVRGHGTSGESCSHCLFPAEGPGGEDAFSCVIPRLQQPEIPLPITSFKREKVDVEGCDVMDELATGSPIDGRPGDPR